ncbi:hypothetical protein DW1_1391 [Proteiniborus sp. DW1]|uniref:YgaP family membrane protein n=1 Tax=Proteiniborus sp. DW1 TaxID=1889883 RepID=UPI00092E1B3F|nr:DUF2892 domain-containing protein [Proteiniborus sp. DW1]SCG82962.1 hypothetical protein DW1_1391 [Proteiniborus sp. DW1]
MKDKKNIGDIDATLRLSGGFTLLGTGIIKKSTLMIIAGSIMLAEGITRFSPLFYLLGFSTYDEDVSIKISKEFY